MYETCLENVIDRNFRKLCNVSRTSFIKGNIKMTPSIKFFLFMVFFACTDLLLDSLPGSLACYGLVYIRLVLYTDICNSCITLKTRVHVVV